MSNFEAFLYVVVGILPYVILTGFISSKIEEKLEDKCHKVPMEVFLAIFTVPYLVLIHLVSTGFFWK